MGFVDTETFSDATEYDLAPLTNLVDGTSRCVINIIGTNAYAFYMPTMSTAVTPAALVVKMSLATRTVDAVWPVPQKYFAENWLDTDMAVQGLQPSTDPNKGLLMTVRRSGEAIPGISIVTLNLETGEFSEEVIVERPDVQYLKTYAVLDGRRVFGLMKEGANTTSQQFLADIETKEVLWEQHTKTPLSVHVDQERGQMLITQVPSAGWHIFDVLTGQLVRSYTYITGGFEPFAVWMPNERIAHITSSSRGNGTLTIVKEADGSFVADLVIPGTIGLGSSALVVSDDGKYIYVGSSTDLSSCHCAHLALTPSSTEAGTRPTDSFENNSELE